jgi:hypothetical protein
VRVPDARRRTRLGKQSSGAYQQHCKNCTQEPRSARQPSPAFADFSCSGRLLCRSKVPCLSAVQDESLPAERPHQAHCSGNRNSISCFA